MTITSPIRDSLPPPAPPVFPILSYRRRSREEARRRYIIQNAPAILEAKDPENDDYIKSIILEVIRISNPSPWVEQIVGAVCIVIFLFIRYLTIVFVSDPINQQHCLNALTLLSIILCRVWFTFRERLAEWLDFQVEHPYILVNECNRRFVKVLAVGDPAYRAAPLPTSWEGLTGRERQQPGWERDLCLILTILASTVLLTMGVFGFVCLPVIHQLILPAQPSQLLYWLITIPFFPISFLSFLLAWRLEFVVTNKIYQAMLYFGYNRDTAHPILRGVTDQMLYTYRVPNLPRLLEKQRGDEVVVKNE